MRPSRLSLALAFLLSLISPVVHAEWQRNGNRIGDGGDFVLAVSGPDRAVVAWTRAVAMLRSEVRVQSWTADGDIAPGWPDDGVLLAAPDGWIHDIAVVEDGAGGAFVAWRNRYYSASGIRLHHVTAAGVPAAGWPGGGMLLAESRSAPALAPDGAGGVVVGWSQYLVGARLQRFDGAGARPPGWPAEGITIPDASIDGLCVDSERHIFMGWAGADPDARHVMIVRRLAMDGTVDPTWPESGAALRNWLVNGPAWFFPDGRGGAFSMWGGAQVICVVAGPGCGSYTNQHTTRVLSDGVFDGSWGSGREGSTVAPDLTGGMLIGLINDERPSVLRLDGGGAPMPGWAPEGNPAMTEQVGDRRVWVTGDGQGGAFCAWGDSRGSDHLYASRLDAAGRIAPGWPSTGSAFGWAGDQIQLAYLARGVAVAVWIQQDQKPAGFINALRPGRPGPVIPVVFGVSEVRPNPSNGPIVVFVDFPNEGLVQLDLVDVTGRRVETQVFDNRQQIRSGVTFNAAGKLPAGLYWLRLTQGTRVATRKVAVIE